MKKSVTTFVTLRNYVLNWYLFLFIPLKKKQDFSAPLKSALHVFLILFYFSGIGLAQCPTLFTEDMNGTPGYPTLNNVSVCGVADTLSYYVLNTSGTTLLNSEFILHIPPGMQYGGFVDAFDPAYTVVEGAVSDIQNPSFIFQNIGADSVQIITIGVIANCEVYDLPPTSEFKFDATFNFVYQPDLFTPPLSCVATSTGKIDYSPYIKRPSINITGQNRPNVIISNNNQVCNDITVTQTGIGATVTGFNFTVDGLDLNNFDVCELSIDGAMIPYTHDPATLQLSAFVDDSFLPNGYLAEDEGVQVRICYKAPLVCDSDQGIYNLSYGASFGCSPEEPPCTTPSTADGTLTYTPNFGANADVSVSTVQLPAICGDNAIFDVTVKSTNADPVLGLWEDLKLGFQICESDAFDPADVRINGVSLPPGSYYYEGFDFVVDATTFTSDFDGPGIGFEDVDGDGIFDDLPGGNEVSMQIEAAIKCQDPTQIAGCASIDCSFQQATVTGKRHCGQNFQATPQISPAPVFSYGSSSIGTNETDISPNQDGSILGFDFMQGTGTSQANASVNTVDMEFCYEFGTEGVGPCENGETYFEVAIAGPKVVTTDLEVIESSVTFQGNAVPAGDISSYYNTDSSEIVIRILAGSNDMGMQCYNFSLELDSCLCYPQQYLSTSLRVVENCFDCNGPDGNPCTIVRACEETILASRRTCNCICPMSDDIVELRRTNFGYTDKAMTTQLDKDSVDPIDWSRFLPCDSMYIHVEYEVLDELTLADYDWIRFQLLDRATAGSSMNPAREVIPDFTHTQLQEFSFEKVSASGIRTPIDLSGIDCLSGEAAQYRNLNDGYLDALGFQPQGGSQIINGQSVYNSTWDVLDNERFYIDIQDKDRQAERGRDQGLSGDCWEHLRETLMGGLEKGDKFHLIAIVPMQKNPYRQLIPDVAATPPATSAIRGSAAFYNTVAGRNTYMRATCGSNRIYETHCPGPISASTEYNIDDCSAIVEHTFTMANTPADWYVNEYRPEIMEFDTLLVPIPSPLIYAGNAEVIFNGDTTAISDPDFDDNTTCVVDSDTGQDLCTSNAGTTGYGAIDVSELPMFGVGLPNGAQCELKIRYDLARICPGVIPTPEYFELYYDYSLDCEYNPGGNYCGRTDQSNRGLYGFLGNNINYAVEDCPGTHNNSNLLFDQRDYHLTEDTSFTLIFNDNSNPLPPLTSSITNTLLADAAGASEFNTYEVCAGAGAIPHTNVMTTVTLEPTVQLIDMTSAFPGFSFTQVSSGASGTTYLIEVDTLQPGECLNFELETELLICPYPGVGTMTEIKTTSSCLDLDIAAQLFAGGGEACTSTGQKYEYVAGEAEVQAEWEPPTQAVALCSINEFISVVKNTKQATLTDLEFNFNLPTGLNWIPGSFEYEYPEGSGTWVSISDPAANGGNAFGPIWTLTDDDMTADIAPNGLPGILDPVPNANRLRIRFDAQTECDEYVSNTPLYFETTAADPCESRISSGFTKNEGITINNAIPSDNAQFLLTADPLKYTCGGPVPISVSGINLSQTGGETFMAEACFTFPPSLIYTPSSFQFTAPSYWTPTYVNETTLPGGYTEICFDLPDGIKPLETFAFTVEATPDPMAMCEELLFGGLVKSLVEDQVCVGEDNTEGTTDDSTCDVFVNNTINDQIVIQIAPPAEIADLEVVVACDNDLDSTTYDYTLHLEGVSTTNYNGPVIVEWYRDLNLNGTLDPTDPLLTSENLMVNVMSGQVSQHEGSVTIEEAFSCPVLVKTTLDIECNCSMDVYYMDTPPTPEFVAQFDGPVKLCPGDNFAIETCAGYEFELAGTGTLTETADSVFVSLLAGTSTILTVTSQQADCMKQDFQIEIMSLQSFEIGPYAAMQMCDMECTVLDLNVPEDWFGNMTVTWSPATYLDDPTSFTPSICSPAENITYTVTVVNPNTGCVAEAMFPIEVIKTTAPSITYDGYEDCFLPYDPAKLIVEPAGMSNYKFYYIDETGGGPDVLLQNGVANEFTLPFAQGKFYAIAEDSVMCMVPTDTLCLEIPTCIFDLALTKVMSPTQPLPIRVGDKVTFDITVYNQGTVSSDSITITDNIPTGFALMDATWTDTGGGVAEYFHLGPLAAGDSVTIPVMVEVLPGINTMNSTNQAEISEAFNENDEDYPDIDSVEDDDPDNDAGGDVNGDFDNQTDGNGTDDEDDADPATIPIFDLALIKQLDNPQPMYIEGDVISFTITVVNQGNLDATNIVVTDSLPCGLLYEPTQSDAAGWAITTAPGVAMATLPDTLTPGETATIQIYTTFDTAPFTLCTGGESDPYVNYSWIENATDGDENPQEDIDSEMGSNDGGENDTDPNTTGDNNTDSDGTDGNQDDHDPSGLMVLDVALIKEIDTNYNPGPYAYGDTVKHLISVFSQGNLDPTNIEVIDYLPTGFTFIAGPLNSMWTDNMDGTYATTITDTLSFGDTTTLCIYTEIVQSDDTDAYVNYSEISSVWDVENDQAGIDNDSTPDDDPTNDTGGEPDSADDNNPDGGGPATGEDEDDHDPAKLPIFDLALKKTLATAGPYSYGDVLTFDITVYNQGNLTATNIEVIDYIACGYIFDPAINPDWMAAGSDANTVIADTLAENDSTIVSINLILQSCDLADGYKNTAEISGSEDDMGNDTTDSDADSTADDDNSNDGDMEDNATNGENGDEDDSDFAIPQVTDLAQIKEIVTAGPYMWGDTLQYAITVVNQGTVPTTNIEITDYLPIGLTYDAAINPTWTGAAPTVMTIITDTLAQFDTVVVDLYLILTEAQGGADSFTNISEISSSEDDMGNDTSDDDADSTPNGDASDDEGGEAGTDSDNQFDGDGTDDEDDHDPALVDIFDLALTKTTTETGPFRYGDTLTFDFNVFNQGTIPATNIEITEFTPCGYTFDPSINPDWALVAGNPTTTITDTLGLQDTIIVSIDLIVQPCDDMGAWKNTGEISDATDDEGNPQEDIDSTPDSDPDNDGPMSDNENENGNDDEDDSDFEEIEIYDLAQIKEIITPGPYAWGDTIEYSIVVVNQGNVPASNITVADHIPAGLTYDASLNPSWTGAAPTVESVISGPMLMGDTVRIPIYFVLTQTSGGANDFTNISEISGAEDPDGNDPTDRDADSDADGDPSDDEGGEPNGDSDNQFDGDGSDDEDDHDPAIIDVFDLALNKTTTWTEPITYGDIIPFQINVSNQGNITATNIEVTEYIPCGYIYQPSNAPLWAHDAASSTATATINGPLEPGETYTIDIYLAVQPCADDPSTNWDNAAEISGAEDDEGNDMSDADIDSTPDGDKDNDGDVEDNDTSNMNGDEDDHDIEMPQIFDLALQKVLADGQVTPVAFGDDVTMTIWVYNQGTIPAANVMIAEYLPAGLTLSANDANGWADTDGDGIYDNTVAGPIAIGDSMSVDIVLTVQAAASNDDYVNVAEISGAEDDMGNDMTDKDIDSDTDANPDNDSGGAYGSDDDNTTDGNGEDGADEDDSDPAFVPVAYTDLALTKMLAPTQAQAVMPGAFVDFDVNVCNQGSIDAYNVNVIDYIPSGLIYDDSFGDNAITGWSDIDADGNPDVTLMGPITAFTGCETVTITLQVDPALTAPADLTNVAEITGSEDEDGMPQEDIDSTPDDNPDNETGENDDETEDPDDEDDSDPAIIKIFDEPVYDLALAKTIDPSIEFPLFVGDTVLYNIEVINQGSATTQNIEITDNMGSCLEIRPFEPNGWVDSDNDGSYENIIAGPLAPGQRDTVQMEVVITCLPSTPADVTNVAEISAADDEDGNPVDDIDSTSDSDPTNDGPSEDNETEDPNDEDDHDPETIPVSVFDLALTKKLAPTTPMPIMPGGDVHFLIEVCNQGNVDAFNVNVVDYTPTGLTLSINDPFGWTDTNADGNYENTIDAVPAGQCMDVKIILTIDPNAISPLINQAEISDAEDENGDHPTDIDSTPDDNPNDDTTGDNDQEDGDGTNDEDDHDWEEIMLVSWDLALVKTLADGQSAYIMPGDDVTFTIEIINQGTMAAYNIDIAEYLPADMTLSTADTNGWTDVDTDGVLENTYAGPLAADSSYFIDLVVTIDPAFAGTSLENTAEISDFEDDMGNHPTDNDSTPDDDPSNDPFGDNDQEDGNGTDDEDDSDPEEVFISTGPVYDLALEKQLDPATVTPVYPGDDVTFYITVTNEGNTAVQNITVVDYLPADLSLSPLDINGWADADGDGNPENTIVGPMNPGESVIIPIMVTIDPAFAGTSLENRAEISEMEDDMGNPVDDFDSDPDNVPGDEDGEDDEDGDIIPISQFDLALMKTIAPGGAPSPIMPGDDVTFRIKVFNQGTVAAYNVDVAEYIPSGLTLSTADMNGWVDTDADGIFENTVAGPVLPGMYEFIDIVLTVDPMAVAPASFTNEAEISDAEDENGNHPVDSDSMPDSDPDNDTTTDDATDNTDGDEDDNDIAEINIFEEMFDLALSKIISPEFIGGAQVGDDIPFDIWIINQGNVAATNVEITDYIPTGTSLSAADTNNWSDNDNDGVYETTRPGPLAPGDSMLVEIILTVDATPNPADFINEAEISGADDGNGNPVDDIDSTPDGDNGNDAGGDPYGDSNNHTGDDGNDGDGDGIADEDDHDPEPFPIFDLATKKTTTAVGPFYYGDTITFDYTIYNQGNIPSTNIAVTDYTPCGYEFDASLNPDWSLSGTDATTVITNLVAPGDSIVVSINYIVEACYEITNSAWKNTGEITASEDDKGNDMSDEDVDSKTDSDPNNDGDMSDNNTDGSNGDEDDSDFELIQIFDLAQKKEIVTPGPYAYGDVVTYAITVYNQGNIPATNIGISDFIPSGLIYDPALNPTWSGAAPIVTTVITDTLWSTGDSTIIYIDLSIAPTNDGLAGYTNIAEINGSEDEKGNDTSNNDADSNPDSDPTNDNGGMVGETNDNQVNGSSEEDEDDHDPALVEVFDLALNKTTTTPGPYTYGKIMAYDLTVYNQGSVVASNIEISDHLPCGFKFLPSSNPSWNYDAATGVITTTINSLLVGGDSTTVQLLVEIQACGGTASWRNTAEISGATDGEGNPVTDIDSFADNDPTNDGDMEDNATDGSNGDEDDSDFHDIEVFDLAFTKQLAPTQESPVLPGSDVAYEMTIYNQGNVDAFDITVIDYIPDGLTFDLAANTAASAANANDWNLVNGVPTYIINTLAPLDSIVINIIFTIDGGFRETSITNFGEIAHAADTPGGPNTPDADSNADDDMNNDVHTGDDVVDEHGNIGGDEDDHDPAFISIFAPSDIVIIGDTSIATVDPIATDTIPDVDPEATPVFEEEIEEEEVDCSKYPVYCYHGLAIELMPMGMVETWASDISVNDYSGCPDYKLGIWHESMPMKQPTTLEEVKALPTNIIFTCQTLGNQEVQLYVTDPEGNWNFCETYINVQDNNMGCVETQTTDETIALLGGQVNTWKGDAVQEVLLSTTQADYMTTQDGFYHFELPMEESYTVTPQKNHIPLNGVSTFDLVLMTKHILGVQSFDNPYQWIAADVNQSKTITAFDLVLLRKLILAIDTEFTNNTSWRFVEANYAFTTDNPLLEDFPEQAHINTLSNNMVMDFVAVKIGDINGNVRPNTLLQAESRSSNKIFEIEVADQFLKAGQTYEIDLYAKDISKIQGYQFTVNTREIMIDQVHGALMKKENFGLNNLDAGSLTVSWNQQPNYLVSEEKLFTIQLQANKDTRLSDVLQLNNQPTIAEAYDLEDNIMEVQLKFTNSDNATAFSLEQNQPNPFNNQTTIAYTLPSNSPVELILRDKTGRVIKVVKQDGKTGYNIISLNELDIAPGLVHYQLVTKFGTKSKKMIYVE